MAGGIFGRRMSVRRNGGCATNEAGARLSDARRALGRAVHPGRVQRCGGTPARAKARRDLGTAGRDRQSRRRRRHRRCSYRRQGESRRLHMADGESRCQRHQFRPAHPDALSGRRLCAGGVAWLVAADPRHERCISGQEFEGAHRHGQGQTGAARRRLIGHRRQQSSGLGVV